MYKKLQWLAGKVRRRFAPEVPTRSLSEWEARHEETVRESVEAVLPHLPEGGVFLDIGANIGIFTRLLREARPSATGILFEPVARYADMCRERFSGDEGVEVVHAAVGDEDAVRTIYKAAHNYGANSLMTEIMFDRRPNSAVRPDTVIEEEEIQLVHGSRWLLERGIKHVDVIKTDTEGYDYAVLDGLREWLVETGCRPVLHVELLAEDYHPLAGRQREALDAYIPLGYQPVDLDRDLSGTVGDVLLIPQGRTASGEASEQGPSEEGPGEEGPGEEGPGGSASKGSPPRP
ncbi:FkbM family methyltransferase [bacterium]|nr:FkbM family methyltransferase [bacterium]